MRTDGLEHAVRIPCWITDLESFRRWTRTEDYPERGRFSHLAGEIWIEMGTPDMTLEVASKSSVRKDTIVLRELYWQAGVPEYWLVDARGDRLLFDILRRGRSGYLRTPRPSGWVASRVLGKSFKLTRQKDELGNPEYTLLVR
jgi:Uma2 family endonuclease